MRSGVSAKAAGVGPQALAVAREAARRSGVSLTQWLNAAIIEGATETQAPAGAKERAMQDLPPADVPTLDDVWPRAARDATAPPSLSPAAIGPDARAERPASFGAGKVAHAPASNRSADLDRALAAIAAAPAPQSARPLAADSPTPAQPAGLEQRLQRITEEIEALRSPSALDAGLAALQDDLRAVASTLTHALPRRMLAAFQSQIEALGDRLVAQRPDSRGLAGLEQRLTEVRAALAELPSAERFGALCQEVRALASQVDRHAASQTDVDMLRALKAAVADLSRVLTRTAASEALAALHGDIRALSAKLEPSSGTALAIEKLTQRIEALSARVEANSALALSEIPAQIETVLRTLSERFGAMRPGQADPAGFDLIEQRIIGLAQKLNAADAGRVAAIEGRIADLIEGLKEAHAQALDTAQSAARSITREIAAQATTGEEVDVLRHDINALSKAQADNDRRTAGTLERIDQSLTLLLERRATNETEIRAPAPSPSARENAGPAVAAAPRWTQAPGPRARARRAPDKAPHPLEPRSGAPRRASAAQHVAASEAALATTPAPSGEFDPKATFIAAARRAARAASGAGDAYAAEAEVPPGAPSAIAGMIRRHRGALLVAAVVLVLGIGTVHVLSSRVGSSNSVRIESPRPIPNAAMVPRSDPAESAVVPLPERSAPPPPPSGRRRSQAAPDDDALLSPFRSPVVDPDGAGALAATQPAAAPPVATPPVVPPEPMASPQAVSVLPASIGGPVLRSAAASDDPAAEFEVALRYREGRGVPRSFENAARWFARAADHGLAPAQFRLGCLYEKGQGVKKDLEAARRFYHAAADQGHAKAMHSLAVLYAAGIDGKPDYKTASQWFRRAAEHGVSESQFNLGILYARGIGVGQNLPESYKWFSLAAQQGEQDAAKKRDEVAARLDPQALVAARLAAQTFTVDPQPDDAVTVAAPPGGWDRPVPARPKAAIPRRMGATPPVQVRG